jgi:hypothetical protein
MIRKIEKKTGRTVWGDLTRLAAVKAVAVGLRRRGTSRVSVGLRYRSGLRSPPGSGSVAWEDASPIL